MIDANIHGVAKSRTQLSDCTELNNLWASIKTFISLDYFYSCTTKIQDGLLYWPNEMRAWRNHLDSQHASKIPLNDEVPSDSKKQIDT